MGAGVHAVQGWARALPRGCRVIDLGCGSGIPITSLLVDQGLEVFGVDAAPALVSAFQQNLPDTPIFCADALQFRWSARAFDALLAWGLIFLLKAEDQRRLIDRFVELLAPEGRLLFTAPAQPAVWKDAITGRESVSLGAEIYRDLLASVGIRLEREYEDGSENHYFEGRKS